MPLGGRPRAASDEEREQVRRLSADGASVRRIAKEVFDDERFRGRVERILRPSTGSRRKAPRRQPMTSFDELDDLGLPSELVAELRDLGRRSLER